MSSSNRPHVSPARRRSEAAEIEVDDLDEDSIPHFTLDLDLPPDERWRDIANAYHAQLDAVIDLNEQAIAEVMRLQRWFPAALLLRALPASQRAEVIALAALFRRPVALLAMLQLIYEAFALTLVEGEGDCGCTALLQDHADGVVHARTLDWSLLSGLDALLVDLSVVRSGRLLYRSTTLAGFVGVLTAMRFADEGEGDHEDGRAGRHGGGEGFSISLNYRRPYGCGWSADGEPYLDLPLSTAIGR